MVFFICLLPFFAFKGALQHSHCERTMLPIYIIMFFFCVFWFVCCTCFCCCCVNCIDQYVQDQGRSFRVDRLDRSSFQFLSRIPHTSKGFNHNDYRDKDKDNPFNGVHIQQKVLITTTIGIKIKKKIIPATDSTSIKRFLDHFHTFTNSLPRYPSKVF